MVEKGKIVLLLLILLSATIIGYVSTTRFEGLTTQKYEISVVDALNRSVVINKPPSRIVSTAPSITELLFALGLGNNVVGVTDYCDWPPQVLELREEGKIESIGGYWNPNVEKIVNLNPDLVFVSAGIESHLQLVEQLESLNLTVVVLYPGKSISEIYKNIRLIAKITNRYENGEELIRIITNKIESIFAKTRECGNKPSVLFVLWLNPVYTCGNETYLSEIIHLAGGRNLFEDLTGWPTVSVEEVVGRKPDVILIAASMMPQSPKKILEDLKNDPSWNSTPAVKNNKVFFLIGQGENIFLRPSIRIADAVELLAAILHPEIFGGITVPTVIGDNYVNYLPSNTSITHAP